ncbi:hypothetical protein BZA05DRAFT_441927 [Tricharina praecox]|uniref:uncharacterized protein n=1 Tax=Tricharina praecox TaxID=43433 RepID=UPI002220F88D|nr:uncharacterized protein BZA05DRAFT_441927 [Tricharina praecox]KAI5856239.1 hypothetical protein BZA05DRAFT_441927 [Tricharina praecox]
MTGQCACKSCQSSEPRESSRFDHFSYDNQDTCSRYQTARKAAHHQQRESQPSAGPSEPGHLPWRHLLAADGTPSPTLHFLSDSLFAQFTPAATTPGTTMSLASLSTFFTSLQTPSHLNPTALHDLADIGYVFRQVGWEHIFNPTEIRLTRDGFLAVVRHLVMLDPLAAFEGINTLIEWRDVLLPPIPRQAFPSEGAGENRVESAIANVVRGGGKAKVRGVGVGACEASESGVARTAKEGARRQDKPKRKTTSRLQVAREKPAAFHVFDDGDSSSSGALTFDTPESTDVEDWQSTIRRNDDTEIQKANEWELAARMRGAELPAAMEASAGARIVFGVVKMASESPVGISYHAIGKNSRLSVGAVYTAVEELLELGAVYYTVDEDHVAAMDC